MKYLYTNGVDLVDILDRRADYSVDWGGKGFDMKQVRRYLFQGLDADKKVSMLIPIADESLLESKLEEMQNATIGSLQVVDQEFYDNIKETITALRSA